ncbi:MAG: nuclear transport factor 2 family protein [Burkholderiaceae bacterium]|nr:nuclear transport factor 2 family protein [Burkholderiaceae bacterium]MCD8516227.1 nuclear transport factor 2 family protein [Burkholderiaceae bacterium]MCD8537991.1 nuclear transport factor 2 family protein [Burkholderiaceae bacterium]
MFATPNEAEQAFYQALARGDVEGLMQVWAGDEEILCVHPGGLRLIGHLAVRESWEAILKHGGLHIETSKVVELSTMVSATHSVIEQIRAMGPNGTEHAYCYATNVFHKGPAGWRIVMHHASAAPERASAFDLHDMPGTLH